MRGKCRRRWMVILAVSGGVTCAVLAGILTFRLSEKIIVEASEDEEESEDAFESERETVQEEETRTEPGQESERIEKEPAEEESEEETEEETEEESMAEARIGDESETETESGAQTEEETQTESETQTEEETQTESETLTEEEAQTDTEAQTEPGSFPESAAEGTDYEVFGDPDSWCRDENGLLWIRAGSSLYAEPKERSGFNTGAVLEQPLTDGIFAFSLTEIDSDGEVFRESEEQNTAYFVDGEAPKARIQATGDDSSGIICTSENCSVSIAIEPDGKSGLKSSAYKILPCSADGTVSASQSAGTWTPCGSSATFDISREGLYRVYVRTEDRVGNVAFSGSDVICIDNTTPEISVSGVKDQTANDGEVSLRVSCSDPSYRPGSLQVSISGSNQGSAPAVKESGADSTGAWVEFCDFPDTQNFDDVYEIIVRAEDWSGNKSEKQVRFSLNRFGSVYDLSEETKALLEQYFLCEPGDIVFYETNIDYVGESEIFCRCDGRLRALEKGTDYQVTMEGTEDSWKRYCYTVPASYFTKEGVYELLLTSSDAADNESDTDIQQKRVTFVLDWTAPDCTVSGIQNGGIYEKDKVTFRIIPSDNMGLESIRIFHNSRLLQEVNRQADVQEKMELTLEKDENWQTVQVWLCDQSGNEYWSREMPVFVGSAGLEVPAYRKMKKSAMELATGEREEEVFLFPDEEETQSEFEPDDLGDLLFGGLDEEELEEGAEELRENMNGFANALGDLAELGMVLNSWRRRARVGYFILIIGFLAFAGTAVFLFVMKKKGGK